MAFGFVSGFNNSPTPLSVQPATPDGLLWSEVNDYGVGAAVNGYQYIDLVWNVDTRQEYNDILDDFGFTEEVISVAGTAEIQRNDNTWQDANVYAKYISAAKGMALWRNLTIRLFISNWIS